MKSMRQSRSPTHFANLQKERTAKNSEGLHAEQVKKEPGAPITSELPKLAGETSDGQVVKLDGATTTSTGTESKNKKRKQGTKKTPEEIAKLKANAIEAGKTPEGVAATKKARSERKDKTRTARTARQEKAKARNAALKIASNTSPTAAEPTTKTGLPPTQDIVAILHTLRLISPDGQTALRRTNSDAAANIQHEKTKAENITKINNVISKLNNFTKRPQQDISSITAAFTDALKNMPARQLNSANSSQKDKIIAEMQAELAQLKQQGQQPRQQGQQQGQPQKPPDYSGFLGRLRSIRDIFSRSQYSSNVNKAKRKEIQKQQKQIKTKKTENKHSTIATIAKSLQEQGQGQGQGQEGMIEKIPEVTLAPAQAVAPEPAEKLTVVTPVAVTPVAVTPVAPAPAPAPAEYIEPRIGAIFNSANGGSRKKQLFRKKSCQKAGFNKSLKKIKKKSYTQKNFFKKSTQKHVNTREREGLQHLVLHNIKNN